MTIKTTIAQGGKEALLHTKDLVPTGLLVYTEPFRDYVTKTQAAVNPTYGADMNQNVSFGGTPDGVHNGTDSALWTASAISGTWTFDSTAQAQAGTKSIDATATVNNDEALLTRASTISTGDYTALTGYIYITSWPTSGTKDVEVRCRNGGVDQGNLVGLSTYVDTTTFNTWLPFIIPIEDFGLGTINIDEIVVQTIDIGGGAAPNYYLDTIQWEETGGAEVFSVTPDAGTKLYVTDLTITMADAYVSTLADATHQKIPYNAFLGVSKLTNGIRITLTTDNIVRFNGIFQQHIDFLTFPGVRTESGGDGTNTWITYQVRLEDPFVMDSRTNDEFEVVVNDDLSGLLFCRVFARGRVETIS